MKSWIGIVISTYMGKVNQYFVDDPTNNTDSKIQEFIAKTKKANQVARDLVHEEEEKHAQEEAKMEKKRNEGR